MELPIAVGFYRINVDYDLIVHEFIILIHLF